MNFADTQTCFTDGLKPDCSADQLQRATNIVLDNERIPASLALKIYTNNTSGARRNALHAAYPACLRILGENCFNNIARQFINQTPSKYADLNQEGMGFSDFLRNFVITQSAFTDFQYLGDLAQLEWHCHRAYYADDDAAFDFELLANSSNQESVRFRLTQSTNLISSDYPIMALRQTNLSDDEAIEVTASDLPEYLVVSRHDFHISVTQISKTIFDFLCDIRERKPLKEIIDGNEMKANRVIEFLPSIIQHGWVCNVAEGR